MRTRSLRDTRGIRFALKRVACLKREPRKRDKLESAALSAPRFNRLRLQSVLTIFQSQLFEPPERTRRVGRTLDDFLAVFVLRRENRREWSLLGPLGGRLLEINRLVGDFLGGVDVPRGELLRALDVDQLSAQVRDVFEYSRYAFFLCHLLLSTGILARYLRAVWFI